MAHRRQLQGKICCALLAAGLGRRLEPLTVRHLPKPLFPLGGKTPMIEAWVRKMTESGITRVSMNLCVLKQAIKDYFQDGAKFGADISYVEEDVPSGTLGGVLKCVEVETEHPTHRLPPSVYSAPSVVLLPWTWTTDFTESTDFLGLRSGRNREPGKTRTMRNGRPAFSVVGSRDQRGLRSALSSSIDWPSMSIVARINNFPWPSIAF